MEAKTVEISDLNDVSLTENLTNNTDSPRSCKKPKRVLQFSDGVLEEYSSEDETSVPKMANTIVATDPKSLNWLPWAWYQTSWLGSKMLDGCDCVGEYLAGFFGITTPKYTFEINEYYRQKALETEIRQQQDLEMGGWNDHQRNNVISESVIGSQQ